MTELKLPESFVADVDNKLPTLHYAYQMGYDYGRNGPSEVNCYITLFATPDLHRAWEEGKGAAAAGR